MIRKAIMIGANGRKKPNKSLYGVDADLHHFVKFLKSSIGGAWKENELAGIYNCPLEYFIEILNEIKADFILVYFTGHGKQSLQETTIAINEKDSMGLSQLISLINAPKMLIIMDLRNNQSETIFNIYGKNYLSFNSTYYQTDTSEKYKQLISDCDNGCTIVYSCAVGEINLKTPVGSAFTYSLIRSAMEWFNNFNSEKTLEINKAICLCKNHLVDNFKNKQTPVIRSSDIKIINFPFALKN